MTEYEKLKIELIGIRKFLMNLQIRVLSLEARLLDKAVDREKHNKFLEYPTPKHLICPNCGQQKFRGGSSDDKHDLYLVLWCESCEFQYSPSHD